MYLEKGQTVEVDPAEFGAGYSLVKIDSITRGTIKEPIDVTVTGGFFDNANGLVCRNCSSHSLEYLKLYGLKGITTLSSTSLPARSASVLTGHLNTFIASMQAYYAGALGLGFVNVFYAPMVVGKTHDELHQLAQEFVFSLAQNAFSRGGQTLFTDANVSSDVPVFMQTVPAVCPGGKYVYRTDDGRDLELTKVELPEGDELRLGDVAVMRYVDDEPTPLEHTEAPGHVLTYGDFRKEARAFAHALLDVWEEGDANGKIFEFPKCDFHVSAETFTDPESVSVYEHACRLAAANGSTYFVFDRDAVSLASCCFDEITAITVKFDEGSDDPQVMAIGEACRHASAENLPIFVRHKGRWRKAHPVSIHLPSVEMFRIVLCNQQGDVRVDGPDVTGDHIFATAAGDVMARDIHPDDRILCDTVPMSWREPEFGDATYETGRLIGLVLAHGRVDGDEVSGGKGTGVASVALDRGQADVRDELLGLAERTGVKVLRRVDEADGGSLVMLELPSALIDAAGLFIVRDESILPHRRRLSAELARGILDTAAPRDDKGRRHVVAAQERTAGKDTLRELMVGLGEYYEGGFATVYEVFRNRKLNSTVYCLRMDDETDPYFTTDEGVISHNCRLRVQITDRSLVTRPERLRTVGFQNVTINVPQAAYRASRAGEHGLEGTLRQIGEAMDLAVEAHLQKKRFSESLMGNPTNPLWQLGKVANDGRPYVRLEDATYIIGIIGVNDAVHHILGKELHESEEAMDMALRIVGFMYLRTKEYTERYGLTFKLEESPAESAARKLAKADLKRFREEALKVYKGGDEDHAYYTNSVHVAADAPVDLFERIRLQSRFNGIIEAGAITHAFIGEEHPSAEAIASVVRKVLLRTQCAQLTFSPEFTFCQDCGRRQRGLHTSCDICGSSNVEGETRIVGYFSRISNFNLSKLAELRARQHGRYRVETDTNGGN